VEGGLCGAADMGGGEGDMYMGSHCVHCSSGIYIVFARLLWNR
jgi:hypothetical protein